MTPHKLMSRAHLLETLLILVLLAAACMPLPGQPDLPPPAPGATETPLPAVETPPPSLAQPTPPSSPTQRAIAALAAQLGIAPAEVKVISSEEATWPDGCLGVNRPDMMCTQALVPGHRFILEAQGRQYEARTDRTGAAVVVVPPEQARPATPPAVQAARVAVSAQLGLEVEAVQAVTVQPMTWSNSCLDVPPQPDELCAQVLTPGYQMVFVANGVYHVFHTDQTADQVRAAPAIAGEEPAVVPLLRDLIAGQLGIGADAVQVLSVAAVEWPDACLGVRIPDMGCAQAVTPGYKVVLVAEGRIFTFHTDATGDSILLAEEIAMQ